MTTPVLLFECTVLDTVNNVSTVIRRASEAYNHPSAPGYYADGLAADKQSVTSLRRSVWTTESEFGAGKLDASSVDIANTSELDWLVSNKAAYGYTAKYLLLANRQASYSSAIALATGVVDGASYLWDRISFRWRDPVAFLLDKTAQRRQWGGTNVLPNGVDGVEDIKDQWVPEWWGNGGGYNNPAVCVNTDRWIFQVSNTVMTPTAVYDKGAKMGGGTVQRGSLSALESNTPIAGGWDWYAGSFTAADGTTQVGTFVRVTAKPDGELTVDGYEGATSADRTVAQVAKRLLAAWGITLSAADVAAADILQPAESGIYIGTSEEQRRDAINRLLSSAGFVLWVSPAGVWRLGRPDIPTGTSVATFRVMGLGRPAQSATEGDITEFEWLSDGSGEDQPAYQCVLNHTHNGLVADKNALAGVSWPATSTTRGLQWLTEQWRKATATDNTVLTQAPLARQTKEDAYFVDAAVAETEAARRLTMRKRHGPRRARLHVTFPPAVAAVVDLMSTVTVVLPRWGLTAGAKAIVYDMDVNWRLGDADLYVYFSGAIMATSSNAVIGWPRWTTYATFTADGGSTDATYVPANLGADDLSFVWRSPNLTATNTKFLAVFSRPCPVRLFALVGHNLTRNATFRLRLYSDTGATTQIYDSGDTAVWPRVFAFGTLPWNDNRSWTGQFNDLEITGLRWNRPLWLDSLYLARSARCAISDPTNPAGYVECGLAEFSQGWPVSINFSYGAQYGWGVRTQTVQGIGGRKQFERRDKPRKFQGTIQYLPRDEAMAQGFELQRQADLDVPFFWLPDPTSTTNLIRESYLARNAELGMLSYATYGRDSMPLSLEEAL